jgi:hypothetical protein
MALAAAPALAHTAFEGHVRNSSGEPIEGAWVYAYDSGSNIIYGLSEEDGSYDLTVLPGPGWTLTALAPGYQPGTAAGYTAREDTHNPGPDIRLESAPPLTVVQAAAPIALTAGIDSPEFAGAPTIRIDQPYNVVLGLDRPNAWRGPQVVSGRFRVKWDETALYYAGEVTWEKPRLNSHTDGRVWSGTALEFFIQLAPLDRGRTEYDPDRNWHLVVSAGSTPAWWLFGNVQARPEAQVGPQLLATDRPSGDGIFFRLNVPWAMLKKSTGEGTAAPAPEAPGALGIAIDAADPDSDPADTARKFQLVWPMSDTLDFDPSYLQPVLFQKKAP